MFVTLLGIVILVKFLPLEKAYAAMPNVPSVIIIEASTGANLEIIKEINNEKLSRLYKTVQKLLIKEEFEEKSSDSKALTAKYLKLKAFYRKTVKEYGN